jgi:serine protease Do
LIVTVIDDRSLPSPAKDAGLMRGDVVVGWNGTAVNKSADLIRMVAMTEIGSVAQVELIRRGERLTLQVRVAERPAM